MEVTNLTDSNFIEFVQSNDKVIVKYYAGWCGSCKLMAPKYKRLAKDPRFEQIRFIEVNAEENPETRKIASVANLPYLAIFSNGELLKGDATSKEENIVALLEELNKN